MNYQHSSSTLHRIQESFLTNLLGNIPTKAVGGKLRNLCYPTIFARFGKQVYISSGVKLLGGSHIEIGNGVQILEGCCINAKGHPNNQISFKDRVVIERGVDIRALKDTCICIDEGTSISPYVCIAGPGNIKIGKNCSIAAHVGIFANNHIFDDPTRNIDDQGLTRQGIIIEDDCQLGHAVTILDGVTIGKGSVIGAGAVVAKDIPPYSVAIGVPARVINIRQQEAAVNYSS